jgi:2-polyprenyl-3-methyl-5-hydroxy-6-metoxy-1,4-benzoquinol methylase
MSRHHKYEYHVDSDNNNHVGPKIVRMVGQGKRVLEIGAGPGSLTRLLKNQACRVTAVELDADALPHLSPFCEQVFQRDLDTPGWSDGLPAKDGYEVIVAGDVLEHLANPWHTLASLRPLLAPDGYLVVSLPHIGHNAVIAALLNGDFRYSEWGLLDRTHIRFFGLKNIEELFTDTGYAIAEFDYVLHSPEATELARFWHALPHQTQVALAASPHGAVYQVVVKAYPAERWSQPGMRLDAPPGGPAAVSPGGRCKALLRRWLPESLRRRARQALARLTS